MATQIWALGLIIIVSIVGALGTFFLKLASGKISLNVKSIFSNYKLFVGLSLHGVNTILALIAYSGGELSVLYPFIAFQYVWANLLSAKYLGETLDLRKWCAIALIFLGIFFVGLGS